MRILRILLLPCAAFAAAEAETAKEITEFREAAHRILRMAPVVGDDKAMAARIEELRARLIATSQPMSEQSPPLLTLQNVGLSGTTASTCAMVVRMPAVNPERLASYRVTFTKKLGGSAARKLTSIETGCSGNESMFAPGILLLPL